MVFLGVKVDESTDGALPEISILSTQAPESFLPFLMNPEEKKDGQDKENVKAES